MAILHTVNQSPFERNSLESCLTFATDGAAVMLFENGVYAALSGTGVENQMMQALGRLRIYVLGPDLRARGLSEGRVIPGISVVDYADFVDLAVEHQAVQSWL